MGKKKMFWTFAVLIVVIGIIASFTMNSDKEEALTVQTAKVEYKKIVETVSSTGIIQPETQVKISADVAAKITKMDVNEGDWVEKNQFLVQLDREKYLASVESAEANHRSMLANANLVKENMIRTEKDYKRMKELFDKKLESQAAMDQAYASYKVEKARYQSNLEQVDQANAALKQSKDDLSKTTIYAPMAGTISQLNKEVGEIALGSQFQEDVIMVISNLNNMESLVDVDENDIVALQLGDEASVEVDALPDVQFKGVVSEIASSAKVSSQGTADQKTEFEVKVRISDPGESLRPGMTAGAEIVTEVREHSLVVPIQSVAVRTPDQLKNKSAQKTEQDSASAPQYTPDKDGFVQVVFVVDGDKVNAVQVETGIQSETHIEITSGLSENDQIVTGNYRAISQVLQNGTEVSVEGGDEERLAAND
ncbi:MAG: efflux RND transporter periplasmic adaptor subunit [Calditrichaeota bacterium]|nr:efflux RND transporter periplasmic adaptor subunit [Calditrichota bacterium]